MLDKKTLEGVSSYYSAKAIAVPLPKMAEFTFPLGVVTLESRSSVPSKVVWKDAKIEIFGVGFPSSPQNRILEWSRSHEGLGAQPLLIAMG